MNAITINGMEVEAKKVIGQLAIHYTFIKRGQFVPYGGFTGWTLTHIKSGMAIAVGHYYHSPSLKRFEELAQRLSTLDLDAYWDGGRSDQAVTQQARDIVTEWLNQVSEPRRKTVQRQERAISVTTPEGALS